MKRYAVVTTIETFRHRYVMEMDDDDTSEKPYKDYVTCRDVEEFSQEWIGEHIIDSTIMTETEVIKQFDHDHIEAGSEIFIGWDDATKLQNVLRPEQRKTGNARYKLE